MINNPDWYFVNCTKFKETKTLEYNGKRISLWERASEGQARQKQTNKKNQRKKITFSIKQIKTTNM